MLSVLRVVDDRFGVQVAQRLISPPAPRLLVADHVLARGALERLSVDGAGLLALVAGARHGALELGLEGRVGLTAARAHVDLGPAALEVLGPRGLVVAQLAARHREIGELLRIVAVHALAMTGRRCRKRERLLVDDMARAALAARGMLVVIHLDVILALVLKAAKRGPDGRLGQRPGRRAI